MERVASDRIGVIWEGLYKGAILKAYASPLDMASSGWETAAKTSYPSKVKFSLAPTRTDKRNV